ncbi:exodeoxyribonuclease VII large subunit [Candidatus Parcubacteria bacterium]|nr:exodeoxyribonuclease VII large subunit [Candidatus Parcubacteria bacterium]
MTEDLFSQNTEKENRVFSISDYIKLLNVVLQKCEARIVGETTQVQISKPGHVYFSLKDKADGSIINCVIWKYNYALSGIQLKEGLEIIASGVPSVYAPWGKLSFQAKSVQLVGEGKLKEEYERLKKELTEKGYFAEERKRALPLYPQKIGVITSKRGAVIHDLNSNLGKFGFKIKLVDSLVEGQDAVKDILLAIKTLKKQDIDVLVIMRGGGSLESLLAFNNAVLVKEVVDFPVPVIAGIGHDKDVSLVAMAADVMVSTPTAVANLLNQSWERASMEIEQKENCIFSSYNNRLLKIRSQIEQFQFKLNSRLEAIFNRYREIENKLKISLEKISYALTTQKNTIISLAKFISKSFIESLETAGRQIESREKIISSNNPERQLKLGYCLAYAKGKIIKKTKDVKIGEDFDLQLVDGIINSEVKNIKK